MLTKYNQKVKVVEEYRLNAFLRQTIATKFSLLTVILHRFILGGETLEKMYY